MELTDENIKQLKSLVRVSMSMYDYENWKNGEYFGDARKFWEGAMQGVDVWAEKMRESQKPSTSDKALPIADVGVGLSIEFLMNLHPDITKNEAVDLMEFAKSRTITLKECYGDGSIIYPIWKESN